MEPLDMNCYIRQDIRNDPLSTVLLSPRGGELNLAALNLRSQGDPQAFNLAMGEYIKAMIDSSIEALNRRYPDRRLETLERKELCTLGIPHSFELLFANAASDPPHSKEEELWRGAARGDLALVEQLSSDPAVDVNAEFKDYHRQYTPLNIAAVRGHREIVECLLKNPATDPNLSTDRYTPCPLYGALRANNVEVAHLILADPKTTLRSASDDFYGADLELWDLCPELFRRVIKDPLFDFASAKTDPIRYIVDKDYEEDCLATLLSNPNCDVGCLASCCSEDKPDWVIELFLAQPGLDVNQGHLFGRACGDGNLRAVEYLLADPRIDTYSKNEDGYSPFFNAVTSRNLVVVVRLLFSGIGIDFAEAPLDQTVMEVAEGLWPGVEELLRTYQSDPMGARVRIGLGYIRKLFALVVLLSDCYLGETEPPKRIGQWEEKRRRFFRISLKLPMELQMILCHRVYGSPKDSISSLDFESGFRSLEL